jgi:hypothetical protein
LAADVAAILASQEHVAGGALAGLAGALHGH